MQNKNIYYWIYQSQYNLWHYFVLKFELGCHCFIKADICMRNRVLRRSTLRGDDSNPNLTQIFIPGSKRFEENNGKLRTVRPTDAIGFEPSTSYLSVSRAQFLGHWFVWGICIETFFKKTESCVTTRS